MKSVSYYTRLGVILLAIGAFVLIADRVLDGTKSQFWKSL